MFQSNNLELSNFIQLTDELVRSKFHSTNSLLLLAVGGHQLLVGHGRGRGTALLLEDEHEVDLPAAVAEVRRGVLALAQRGWKLI